MLHIQYNEQKIQKDLDNHWPHLGYRFHSKIKAGKNILFIEKYPFQVSPMELYINHILLIYLLWLAVENQKIRLNVKYQIWCSNEIPKIQNWPNT